MYIILIGILLICPLVHTKEIQSNINETSLKRIRRVIGGLPANYPPYDDPVVFIRFRGKSAKITGTREYPHYVFKGIKYAEPPTGTNRFLRPRQKFLDGDVQARLFSPPCIQPVPGKNRIIGSEDCLALNIYTPNLPTGMEGLPVIVWIHGGGFRYGSASQYGARHLVNQHLVVVTIQYRLGSLGFLSTGSKQMPGNVALWDMAIAIQWVRNYIGFFGGNPNKITIMGHNTGASSALLLALSKTTKDKPSGIIAMSGTAISPWAVDNNPTNTAKLIAEENDCPTANIVIMIQCLQKVPAEFIIQGDSMIEFQQLQKQGFVTGLNGKLATSPVTEDKNDDRSLPSLIETDPMELLQQQKSRNIPLLIGVTKDETKRAINGHFKQEVVKLLSSPKEFGLFLIKELEKKMPFLNRSNETKLKIDNVLSNIFYNSSINYLKIKDNDINDGLNKVAEVTADVLFNVPAYITADLWKAPAFLYSFEHVGKLKKGSAFLNGFPLIGNHTHDINRDDLVVSHGDDLSYIFDAHDINGNTLIANGNVTDNIDDLNVRNSFVKMFADFARHGEITIKRNEKITPFSTINNNFIQIKDAQFVLANKFRFCQIALWTRIGTRLHSSACELLKFGINESHDLISSISNTSQLNAIRNKFIKNKSIWSLSDSLI